MINVKIDVSSPIAGLFEIDRATERAFRELARPLRNDQTNHARAQEGSDGKWEPRQFRVRRSGRRKGRLIRPKGRSRKILGRLPRSYRMQVSRRAMVVFSRAPWSAVHQDGGVVGNNQTRAKIPRREFLYASDEFMDQAIRHVGGRLLYAWNRGS